MNILGEISGGSAANSNVGPRNTPKVSGERVEGRVGNVLPWFCNEMMPIWGRISHFLDTENLNNLALCSRASRKAVRQRMSQRVVIVADRGKGPEEIKEMLTTACEPRIGCRLEIRVDLYYSDAYYDDEPFQNFLNTLEEKLEAQSLITRIEMNQPMPSKYLYRLAKLTPNAELHLSLFNSDAVSRWIEILEGNQEFQQRVKTIVATRAQGVNLKRLLELTPNVERINMYVLNEDGSIDSWVQALEGNPNAKIAVKMASIYKGLGDSLLKLLALTPELRKIHLDLKSNETEQASLSTEIDALREHKDLGKLIKNIAVYSNYSVHDINALLELTPNVERLVVRMNRKALNWALLQSLKYLVIYSTPTDRYVIDNMPNLETFYLDVKGGKDTPVVIRNMGKLKSIVIDGTCALELLHLPELKTLEVRSSLNSLTVEPCDKLENIRIDGKRHVIEAIDAGNNEASDVQRMTFQRLVMSLRPNMKLLLPLLVLAFVIAFACACLCIMFVFCLMVSWALD